MNLDNVYFHFTSDKLRDGTPIPPIGEWLIYPRKPIICKRGLHASKHPYDALKYAPGTSLHLVELNEIETVQNDKVVAKGRRILMTIESSDLLLRCSRKFASDVLQYWDAPKVVKDFLRTGNNTRAWAAAAGAGAWAWAAEAAAGAAAARAAEAAAWAARAAARAAEAAARAAEAAEAAARAARAARAAEAAEAAAWAARAAAWAAEAAARAAEADLEVIHREYFLGEILKEFGVK